MGQYTEQDRDGRGWHLSYSERGFEVLGSCRPGGYVLPSKHRTILISVNPLFAFSFLESFLETLQDYLGDVTETAIKDNFDIVYMVRLLPLSSSTYADG